MYAVNWENLREVTEKCMAGSVFSRHAMYALHFLIENTRVPVEVGDVYTTTDPSSLTSGLFQRLVGTDSSYFLGLVDLREGLKAIAKGFAGDEFEDDWSFISDASGEMINRINGEYVISEAKEGEEISLEPQLFLEEEEARSRISFKEILHIPISLGGCEAEIVFIS
jgi:hypothetical protein